MTAIDRSARSTRAIPLTPLIDVVFLLMVFFILTTHYVSVEALRLGVIEDGEAAPSSSPAPKAHELVLLGSGAAFLNNKLVYYGDLEDRLDVLFHHQPGSLIQVKCDEKVSVQFLIDALDMIRRSGGGDVKVSRWQPPRGGGI